MIPHLLVPELREAILSTPARRILVMNIAAADETDGFTASRHIELLAEHAPTLRLDFVLADVGFVGSDRHLTQFAARSALNWRSRTSAAMTAACAMILRDWPMLTRSFL